MLAVSYATCRNCSERFFAGQNPAEHGLCGICAPRGEAYDWSAVPNLRTAGEMVMVAFQDAAAGEQP